MGLVAYASSDDEGDDEEHWVGEKEPVEKVAGQATTDEAEARAGPLKETQPAESKKEDPATLIGPVPQSAVPLGPHLPSAADASITSTSTSTSTTVAPAAARGAAQASSSPYSASRALIHDLTLPSVPNLDIPPSPPGSPPPGANEKFEQFLQLKKKGTHFNSRLQQSAALRNPALMDKLLAYVGIDEAAQYETTLPADLWDPKAFPKWAFRDQLRKSRETIAKEKETNKASGNRSAVDFVPSVAALGGSTAGSGGLASRGEKRKGGWK